MAAYWSVSEADKFIFNRLSQRNVVSEANEKIILPPVGSSEIWIWDTADNDIWKTFIENKCAKPFLNWSNSDDSSSSFNETEVNLNSPWLYLPIDRNRTAKLRLSFHWITVPTLHQDNNTMETKINLGDVQLRLVSEPNGLAPTGEQILFEIFSDVVRCPRNSRQGIQDRYKFSVGSFETWSKNGPLLTKRLSISHLSSRQSIGLCSINPNIRYKDSEPIFGIRTTHC